MEATGAIIVSSNLQELQGLSFDTTPSLGRTKMGENRRHSPRGKSKRVGSPRPSGHKGYKKSEKRD